MGANNNGWITKGRFIIYVLTIVVTMTAAYYKLDGRIALCEQTTMENQESVKVMTRELSDIKAGIARIEAILQERKSKD